MKKLLTSTLAGVMILGSTATSFASYNNLDLVNRTNDEVVKFTDFALKPSMTLKIWHNMEDYVINVGGKLYNVAEVNAVLNELGEGSTLAQAVKGLTPVEIEEELKVIKVSAIDGKVTVNLNREVPSEEHSTLDLNVFVSINESEKTLVSINGWRNEPATFVIPVPAIEATDEKQTVEYTVVLNGVETVAERFVIAPVVEEGLKVIEVSAINASQIKIVFNKEVDAKTIIPANFYLGLTKDVTNNIAKHNSAGYIVELQEDEKTVIISGEDINSTDGHVIWTSANTGNATALNTSSTETVLENRTVYVQIKDVRTKDGVLAHAMEGSFVAKDTKAPKFAEASYEVEKVNVTDFEITFNEPVVFESPLLAQAAKFYLNGTDVTAHVDYVTPVAAPAVTVDELSTIVVDLSAAGMELDANNNIFEVVGLQDLAGNATVPGRITTKIEVKEKEVTAEAPKVKEIKQIHDAAFTVTFDKALSNTVDGTITIKNLLNNNVDVVFGLGYTAADGTATTTDNKTYTVVFDTDLTDGDEAYKSANEIIRDIVVEGHKVTVNGTDYKGTKHTSTERFIKDRLAPTVKGYAVVGNDVEVEFKDAPFNGAIKAGVAGDIIVKYVEDGITYTYDSINVDPATAITGNKVKLGLNAIDAEKLFKEDGITIKPGITFTVKLPYGLVKDDKADLATPQYLGEFDFIGDTITVTTDGTADQEVVPQTSQANIYFVSSENLIKVGFVGESIDAKTVTNKANYTFDGSALPAGTVIEYSEGAADADVGNATKVAYIYLPMNSVVRNGNYQLTIKNVATKKGAKMLPTEVTVYGVTDNTQPVMSAAKVTSDNTVEVTFDETLNVTPLNVVTNAERNFFIVINGVKFNVASVTAKTNRVLVVTTADTFDYNLGVKVQVVNDASNDMFVKDVAGNAAAERTVTATIDIQ